MMRPWIIIGLGVFLAVFVLGVLITGLPKRRAAAEQEACKNNLKDLAFFAALYAHPDVAAGRDVQREIPAGTIVLPEVPPDGRLSWVVHALPTFDQRHQKTTEIVEALAPTRPWSEARNQEAARRKLVTLLCPGQPPEIAADHPAPTQYLGIAGLRMNAVVKTDISRETGCFRYDVPTPFTAVTDGLSQTLLFGERSTGLGPWLRGGPSTLRGLVDDETPLIGRDGQFGGNHPESANWALADGSIRVFTPRVERKVLLSMATIEGKETDVLLTE